MFKRVFSALKRIRGQKNDLEREEEAGRMMRRLYARFEKMKPGRVIEEMVRIHEYSHLPIYWYVGYYNSVTYTIFFELWRHPDLTAEDTERWAQMLLWREFKTYTADNHCRLAILAACERFPTSGVLRILQEHLEFVLGQLDREHYAGTQYTDLLDEVVRIEDMLNKPSE